MKKLRWLVLVLSVGPIVLLAQSVNQKFKSSGDSFRLSEWHPYVYLEVDHIGPREPRNDGEPKEGIWLHLHNNCRMPIVVLTFGVPPGSSANEVGVLDNVIADSVAITGERGAPYEHWPSMTAIPNSSTFPGTPESQPKTTNPTQLTTVDGDWSATMPHGYMFPVSSSFAIMPGQSIYFSLPINHVSKTWHFEIPFRFDLKRNGPFREPNSSLAFFWDDLPETYRKAHDADQALPSQNP